MPFNRLDVLVFGTAALAAVVCALFAFQVFFRYQYLRAGPVLTRVDRVSGRTCVMPCLPAAEPVPATPVPMSPATRTDVAAARRAAQPSIPTSVPRAAAVDAIQGWPEAQVAYTVILSSVRTRAEAEAKATALRAEGAPVGVLRSNDYVSLRPGYWVVFSGQYRGLTEAQNAATAARAFVRDAYAKRIIPK